MRRFSFPVAILVCAAGVFSAAGCSSGSGRVSSPAGSVGTSAASAATPKSATTATTSTTSTTSTTVDPGTQPQTGALPSQDDPAFQARIADLWKAIVDGVPSEAAPAFFPLSAYIQVKAISDPVHDYQTRLIANFDEDILALHRTLPAGSPASLSSVDVPATAAWIKPGVEYNKGSYWRVLATTVAYVAGGARHTFEIHSMISWRAQWYIVHLGAIR